MVDWFAASVAIGGVDCRIAEDRSLSAFVRDLRTGFLAIRISTWKSNHD